MDVCVELTKPNKANSITVYTSPPFIALTAVGYWKQIVISTESISYEVEIGMTSTDSNTTTQEKTNALTASINAGVSFEKFGFSAGVNLTDEYTDKMS